MTKYKFIKYKDKHNEFDTTNVLIQTETVILDDLLESFKEFLLASGYSIKGDIEIVDNEIYDREDEE